MLPLILAVLAQVPEPVPAPWAAGGSLSPVVSSKSFNAGTDNYPSDLASPTIDCVASTSGEMVCSGATATKTGSPTTGTSPFWWRGATSVAESVVLNGSSDYYDLGNVGGAGGSFSHCTAFMESDISGVRYISGRATGSGAATAEYVAYSSSGNVFAFIAQSGSEYTASNASAITAGSWNVYCYAYEFVTDGTSRIRTNLNGVATTEVTNAHGPIQSGVVTKLTIGAGSAPTNYMAGRIRRDTHWTGTAFSATDLARLVASQWGLTADKPSTDYATHARTDSTLCCPFSDAECYWVGPGAPCVHAPTYSGWAGSGGGIEVYGVGANALLQSETFANASWVKAATVAASDASASCPFGPTGIRMSLVTSGTIGNGISQDAATTPGRSVWLARATGDSACDVTMGDADGTGDATVVVASTPTRVYQGAAGNTGLRVIRKASGCTQWCMWAAQGHAGIPPMPYRATTGSAYSGSAGTATALSVPVRLVDPSRWAVGVTATLNPWGASSSIRLFESGTYTAANSWYASLYYFGVFNAGASQKYVDWSTKVPSTPSTHTILLTDNSGTLDVVLDGSKLGLAQNGSTGLMTSFPASVYIGSGTTGAGQINGLVSRVVQCRAAGGCR